MMFEEFLFYTCQPAKLVPTASNPLPGFNYCMDWQDFKGMGISVIGYFFKNHSGFLLEEEFYELEFLADEADFVVGYNSEALDDKLLKANDVEVRSDVDLLIDIREATGHLHYSVPGITDEGYSFEDLVTANDLEVNFVAGSLAAFYWQCGCFQEVIDSSREIAKNIHNLYCRFGDRTLIDPLTNKSLIEIYKSRPELNPDASEEEYEIDL